VVDIKKYAVYIQLTACTVQNNKSHGICTKFVFTFQLYGLIISVCTVLVWK